MTKSVFNPTENRGNFGLTNVKNPASSLNLRQTKFLTSARLGDCVTTSQYAQKTEISLASALRDLTGLQTQCYVERFGKRKSTYFKVVKK
jgi:predicted HTH transcriptional regulator